MSDMQNSKATLQEILGWLGLVTITIGAFVGTYCFQFTGPVLSLVWIGWLVFALVCAFFTRKGKQAYVFAKEAKTELEKVVWPSRQEATQTTFIVMIMVTVTGFVLWGIDSGMMWAIGKITQLG